MSLGGLPHSAANELRVYKWIAAFVVAVFLLLAARLWQLQVMQGDRYYHRATDNFVKERTLPATRGQILDRKGRVLVDNRPSYNVYVVPRLVSDDVLARLAKHLTLSDEQRASLATRIAAKKGADRAQPLLAVEDISRDQVSAVESDHDLAGVSVEALAHRNYPYGKLAAHTLGYLNQISAEELAAHRGQGYRPGDYVGRTGIEEQFEYYLRGRDGFEREIVDAKNRVKNDLGEREIEALINGPRRREPEPGKNVTLTLDLDLQQIVEKALSKHHSAAAVVVEVDTGNVLALGSYPSYDPNVLTGHLTRAQSDALEQDPFRPLIDKAVQGTFYPASTFKVIPALAGLEDKTIGEYDKIPCHGAYEKPGHTFHCMESHGPVALYDAVVRSCDVYFYVLGEKVTMDRMAQLAYDFGFGARTGIALPTEADGFVPTTDYYKKNGGFRIGYTLNTAIGQGATKVTALQMALAYATIANGGDLYMPQLVERIETPSGQPVQEFAPRVRRHVPVAAEHLEALRRALCGVVNDPKGTAHSAHDPSIPFEVCGKSGTAQVRKVRHGEAAGWDLGNDHAWFSSFAPARHPKIAVAVVVEHGGLGGHVAGPTVMEIIKGYAQKVEPSLMAQSPTEKAP